MSELFTLLHSILPPLALWSRYNTYVCNGQVFLRIVQPTMPPPVINGLKLFTLLAYLILVFRRHHRPSATTALG